jgi:hypothetical protein
MNQVSDCANNPQRMTEAQLRAGMLFDGCREEYAAELCRRVYPEAARQAAEIIKRRMGGSDTTEIVHRPNGKAEVLVAGRVVGAQG